MIEKFVTGLMTGIICVIVFPAFLVAVFGTLLKSACGDNSRFIVNILLGFIAGFIFCYAYLILKGDICGI